MISEKPPFKEVLPEHKDISGERRPKYSHEIGERVRAEFFLNLMDEALRNYDEARKQNSGKKETPLRSIEFFFKKAWDKFTEPVLEYEDMLADIMAKEWESKGAKSRALNRLKEARARTVESLKVVMPDFEELDLPERRKAIAKLYEGYAAFINAKKSELADLADAVNKGFISDLKMMLKTENDELLKRDMLELLAKKKRKREARKARKSFEKTAENAGAD